MFFVPTVPPVLMAQALTILVSVLTTILEQHVMKQSVMIIIAMGMEIVVLKATLTVVSVTMGTLEDGVK